MLLNAMHYSYENLKDVMLYGRIFTITVEEVQGALKAKELHKCIEKRIDVSSE